MAGIKTFLQTTGKKTKEEVQRERERNRSLTVLPKAAQNALGIRAIQKEDCVFQIGKSKYIKIYSVRLPLGENRQPFMESLCGMTTNRIRLSVFCKNKEGKHREYMFMSIYFSGSSYADVYAQTQELDTKLNDQLNEKLHIPISACSIDSVLMFIHMISAGEMKKYDVTSLADKKAAWKNSLYQPVTEMKRGEFLCHGKYGICFLGKLFPDHKAGLDSIVKGINGNIQFVVDMQMPTGEEVQLQDHEMGKKYSCSIDTANSRYINLTYLCTALADSEEERVSAKKKIIQAGIENEILLVPCCGRETEVFHSVCSLGIQDFRSMRNVDMAFAESLLL